MAERPSGPAPGQILAGKYRVEATIGAGAMGVVVAATHLDLEERVALKFLAPDAARSSDAVARFLREARAAAKIKSEHVARVCDVGRLASGEPYLVMELLVGTDLEQKLRHEHRLSIERATTYVLQTCEAIAEAHALGIVHRDLKPANLFLSRRADGSDSVKVLDFGASKFASSGREMQMTSTNATMGTPLYMSPEQWESSKRVDARSDIWSLGAILYELLTGKPPFDAVSITQLAMMLVSSRPPPLRSHDRSLPQALQDVVMRCLEREPVRRYGSVADLAAALAPFAPAQGAVSARRTSNVLAGSEATAVFLAPDAPAFRSARAIPGGSSTPTVALTTGDPSRSSASLARTARVGRVAFAFATIATVAAIATAAALLGRFAIAPASAAGNAADAVPELATAAAAAPSSPRASAPQTVATTTLPSANASAVASTDPAPSGPASPTASTAPSTRHAPRAAQAPSPTPPHPATRTSPPQAFFVDRN